jgi:glycosyltransferase involved in cell wall biosynthesis
MQFLLSHPSVAPFVQQVGRALWEDNMLEKFATTLTDYPDANWRKFICQFAKMIRIDLAPQLQRRAIAEFPLEVVVNNPWGEIANLIARKVDRDGSFSDFVWEKAELGYYANWVASLVDRTDQTIDAIYGYECCSLPSFARAKQLNKARVYDVPSPEHDFVHQILQTEIDKFPELRTPYRQKVERKHEERTQLRREEWNLADLVVANSDFTKNSYQTAGLDIRKVIVVPYGAPPPRFDGALGGSTIEAPIRFLWAGTFSIRKGAHYLLEAWKQLRPLNASLQVLGAMGLPERLLQNLPDSIAISGTVPRSQLYEIYGQSDVFVFPTLCDGFGMVVTEALAQGLPVIATDRAGASELIQHGKNGFLIPAGDTAALVETMDWCMTHRQELKAMRQAALDTAARWQWSDYRAKLIEGLKSGLQKQGVET